jgi:hypothetical protein
MFGISTDPTDSLHRFGARTRLLAKDDGSRRRDRSVPGEKLMDVIRQCLCVRRLNIAALPFEAQSQKQLFAILPRLPALRHLLLGNTNVLELTERRTL